MTNPPNFQAFYPFTRLNRLLEGVPPGPSPATDGEQVWFLWAEERGDLWVMDVESSE